MRPARELLTCARDHWCDLRDEICRAEASVSFPTVPTSGYGSVGAGALGGNTSEWVAPRPP